MATTLTISLKTGNPAPDGVMAWLGVTCAADGLPALVGSPKQIAWASEIRARAVGEALGRNMMTALSRTLPRGASGMPLNSFVKADDVDGHIAKLAPAAAKLAAKLDALTSARWWIDNRDRFDHDAANLIARGA